MAKRKVNGPALPPTSVLPPSLSIASLNTTDAFQLLSSKEQREVMRTLEEDLKVSRRAAASSHSLRFG